MALQFVIGSSGSGKTEWLYERLLRMAEQDKKRMFYLIVPEQFTLQAQKALVQRQKKHAIMNIDVVSFDRLAYRVFDELGKTGLTVLEDTGKNLILRKLAEDNKEKLTVLRRQIHRMGYIDQIKSLISEFMQYGFSAEDLEDYLKQSERKSALSCKLSDMQVLYEAFEQYLSDGYVTSEGILTVLADCVQESKLLESAVLALDGFTGFTPVQMQLLRRLLHVASEVFVTVTMDAGGELYADRGIQELFYMSRKMVRGVTKLAQETGCKIAEPVLITGEKGRFARNETLAFLEQHLFHNGRGVWKKSCVSADAAGQQMERIAIASLANPREELLYTADRIRQLVRDQKLRYEEIAIVSGSAKAYETYVEEVFTPYGIPIFSDVKENVYFHPLTEWVRAFLEISEKNYQYESVFRYLRTGLAGFTWDEIDLLDNYVLQYGIRGYKKWEARWVRPMRTGGSGTRTEEEELATLQYLNELRERFLIQTEAFYKTSKKKESTVRELTTVLYQQMEGLNLQGQLEDKHRQYEEAQNEVQASLYGQIYRVVIDLLDKTVKLLGDEAMPVKEYAQILDAGFQAAKVGVVPPGADCVILGDIERTRLDHVKVLFFLGVNDGVIPQNADRQNLLSQYERELLLKEQIELAPTAREQVFLQKFYLYLNMTKPSEALYLTYARMDSMGTAQKPSYLITTICRMFPELAVREVPAEEAGGVLTPENSVKAYVQGLGQAKKGQLSENWKVLHHWRMSKELYRKQTAALFDAAFSVYEEEQLKEPLARQLYGSVLHQSVTRLETFARCACAHFLKYGLRLQERPEYTFEPTDMGMVFHNSLECYSRKMEEAGLDWFDITREQQQELLQQAVEETVLGMDTVVLSENARSKFMIERISNILGCSVWALTGQLRKGEFHPLDYEVAFRQELQLREGKMLLGGRIDRLDICENDLQLYVKVMDYKSGKKKFSLQDLYEGLSMQLILYMTGAVQHLKRNHGGKDLIPAGVLYYHLDQPVIDSEPGMAEEQVEQMMFEKLRPEGLVNSDPAVVSRLDREITGKSDVIPVTLNKDGSLSKRGCSVATREQFELLEKYAVLKMKEQGEQILSGKIAPRPVSSKDIDGCEYCPYREICEFDPRIPGYEHQEIEPLSTEEIWRRIEQKVNGSDVSNGKES